MAEYDGLLPLNKPRGMTSHDCIVRLRKLLGFRKIGHTGTLDPEVDGVLVLCLGKATKIAQYLLDYGKVYKAVVHLGSSTTTEDASGEIIERRAVHTTIDREELRSVFKSLEGEIEQTVPMYSAVKVNGKKLYEYARAGISVEQPVRRITIYALNIDGKEESFQETIPFTVSCSKGTYIRTLAVDIGRKLGYPAHLESLTRIKAGPFAIADCLTFEQIESKLAEGRFSDCLRPLEYGLSQMDHWTVDDDTAGKILHGAVLHAPGNVTGKIFAVFDQRNRCLAIYEQHPEKSGFIKPNKVLASNPE